MYTRDEAADTIIAGDEKLQAAVEGRTVLLLVPGHAAGVSTNLCLMFGWMGALIAIYRMVPQLREMMQWYAVAAVTVMSAMGVIYYAVLRGRPSARSRMYAYTITSLAFAIAIVAVALVRADWVAAGLAAVGVVFVAIAVRVVAGPSYALLSAFFRAQRVYMDSARGRAASAANR